MSKMTTEQFLSHLGIEVGKPFMCDGRKIEVHESRLCIWIWTDENRCQTEGFDYLLDKEITPLPKYTLTEDEKGYVRITTLNSILRDSCGELVDSCHRPLHLPCEMFPFLKVNEFVDVDELKECL